MDDYHAPTGARESIYFFFIFVIYFEQLKEFRVGSSETTREISNEIIHASHNFSMAMAM
jgi:hypothetical protein